MDLSWNLEEESKEGVATVFDKNVNMNEYRERNSKIVQKQRRK